MDRGGHEWVNRGARLPLSYMHCSGNGGFERDFSSSG